jgi:hypothetical protein
MNALTLIERLGDTAGSVAVAVMPLTVLFLVFQVLFLQLPVREVSRILIGTLIASAGLFLFLLGVGIALLPFGRAIGEAMGALPARWLIIPIGLLLGFVTAWGEPAVRILADQVDEASSGSIRRALVVAAIAFGVALSAGIGMARIGYGIPLAWLLVPGYALTLVIMWFSDKDFVAIAVDAGGVATGPLANTFLLALALGVSSTVSEQDPLLHGLGLVALTALAPVMVVMALGLLIRWKERGTSVQT